VSLIGASALRNRLRAIEDIGRPISQRWADSAVRRIQSRIPVRTGQTRRSVHASTSRDGAQVLGSPVVNFLSSGTKAHDESPHKKVLRFQVGGQTVFSKKVHKPATLGKHFAGPAATQALSDTHMADTLVEAWNRAG
jgi:hypothetical protein